MTKRKNKHKASNKGKKKNQHLTPKPKSIPLKILNTDSPPTPSMEADEAALAELADRFNKIHPFWEKREARNLEESINEFLQKQNQNSQGEQDTPQDTIMKIVSPGS